MARNRKVLSLLTVLLAAGAAHTQEDTRAEERFFRAAETRAMELRNELGMDGRHGFKAISTHVCELGQVHTRMNQYFNGVRVWDGQIIDHSYLDETRGTLPFTNAAHRDIPLTVEPTLLASEALGFAEARRNSRMAYYNDPTTELVIWPEYIETVRPGARGGRNVNAADVEFKLKGYRLAYHVHTEAASESDIQHWDYMVDAHTGEVFHSWNSLQTDKGTAKTQYNGTQTIDTTPGSGGYQLIDPTRGSGGKFGGNAVVNANQGTGAGTVYTDSDNTWGDGKNYSTSGSTTSANGQTPAADVAYAVQVTWDMAKSVLNRNGINGRGTGVYAKVHVQKSYDNAFWDPSSASINFGDGSSLKNLTSIDVVGHELGHAVNSYTANLGYYGVEAGGLNETNSDIWGTMAEFYARGGASGNTIPAQAEANFIMGDELFTNGRAIRWMYKPSKDGKSPDAYKSGIGSMDPHYSAGPGIRFFYFLSQGAETSGEKAAPTYLPKGMKGIGNDRAFKIWYRAATTGFTSNTTFAQARTATIKAAQDLYGKGSAEEAAVHNAWGGVNVGAVWSGPSPDPNPEPDPQPQPTVGVSVSPATATVNAGATYQFKASVTGSSNTGVKWTATGGTISTSGLYTAPANAGTYRVRATAAADSSKFAESTVTVKSQQIPPQPGNGNLILNGGFEEGRVNWGGSASFIGSFPELPAYAGKKCAWMGGFGSKNTETLTQDVTIPANATSADLTFYLQVNTAENSNTAYDFLAVDVVDSRGKRRGSLATYSNLDASSNYQQRKLDLSQFRGERVRIQFKCLEDDSLQTSFVLDEIKLSGGSSSQQGDTTPPAVSASVSGNSGNISLKANATDNVKVAKVEFYVDGALKGSDATSPYALTLDSTKLTDGSHELEARAFDAAGNVGSGSASFEVSNGGSSDPSDPSDDGSQPGSVTDPDLARLKSSVNFLCSNECAGRLTGSAGERVAGNYIAEFFKNAGLEPVKSGGFGGASVYHMGWAYGRSSMPEADLENGAANAWWLSEEVSRAGTAYNIGGVLKGTEKPGEYIVVIAHYDHLGQTSSGIYRGADDNASGTASLMEIVQCLKEYKPKRSILFLAATGEEKGLLGAEAFLKSGVIATSAIKGCINLDMVGRNGDAELHVTPAKTDNLVASLARDARTISKNHGITLSAGIEAWMRQSDHYAFVKRNIPSIFFNTGDHSDYHKFVDTVDKLNFNKMIKVVKIARDLTVKAATDSAAPSIVPRSEWSQWTWGQYTFGPRQDVRRIMGGPAEE